MQVEATKFTEVGFHGRDVDQIIRDLVDNSLLLTKQKLQKKLKVLSVELLHAALYCTTCSIGHVRSGGKLLLLAIGNGNRELAREAVC